MIFNMTGGVPLNFKVKAYASELLLPASAAENTIAVITETPISGYQFSVEKPENPVEGHVWIATATQSETPFSATKKNPVIVYPQLASQYVGGVWIPLTAKTYQHGSWVDWWDGTLFYNGDQYTKQTGGWETYGSSPVSIGDVITYDARPNGSQKVAMARTCDYVDVSTFKTLFVKFSTIVNTGGQWFLEAENGERVAEGGNTAAGIFSTDITNVSGLWQVYVGGTNGRAGSVSKVWLER